MLRETAAERGAVLRAEVVIWVSMLFPSFHVISFANRLVRFYAW
jgi:hypothetical protein